jgi:site-specific recombinase XerD
MTSLEPIEPQSAVELYLNTREDELADSTLRSHESRLHRFAQWCEDEGIDNLNDLSGRRLLTYNNSLRDQYREKGGVNQVTVATVLSTIRVFLQLCETIDAVEEGLHEKVRMPSVDRDQRVRENVIDADVAGDHLEILREHRYGRREHVVFELAWIAGCRIGALHALDVGDVHYQEQRIEIRHRPPATPIKNKERGERFVTLADETLSAIETYNTVNREPMTDEHGREPLFVTQNGRASKASLRNWIYLAQMPCFQRTVCPHGREISECEHRAYHGRKDCPSTERPHDIRRGAITHFLSDDVPQQAVSDRCDVSGDVLSEHYDQRGKEARAEQRRKFFD